MRKEEFIRQFITGLARVGWPGRHVKRAAQEIADHWDDLEAEGRERGMASASFANEQIGDAEVLIRFHQQALRKAHWSGRHPVLSFAVLPPLALVLWFLAWAGMAAGASELYGKLLAFSPSVWGSYLIVLLGTKVIHYTGVCAVPVFFWWWARRSFCGFKWGWIACAACATHGLLNHVTVRLHALHWGYGLAVPDWLPVLAPLIVGAIAHSQSRSRLAMPMLLAVSLLTGCASSKVPQQRGWIGGEYKQVKAADGLLVTALATNTPAARSGLKEGDLIVRLAGKSIDNLQSFRRFVDAAAPGTPLPLTVLRDGATFDAPVLVGREVLKPSHAITVGLLLSREWDLWPNPDFSLIALGYKRQHKRVELGSPEARLKQKGNSAALRSPEGWEIWLPVCAFSSRQQIVSQTIE